jgi:PAS domain-containing protein
MKQWELAGVTVPRQGLGDEVVAPPDGSVRALVDQLPGIVWTTDAALRLTSLFGEGLRSLRLGPNQIVGWTLLEFAGTSDWPMIVAHRRALSGAVGGFELEWGRRRFHARVGPLHDARGELIGTVCVAIELAPEKDSAALASVLPMAREPLVLP